LGADGGPCPRTAAHARSAADAAVARDVLFERAHTRLEVVRTVALVATQRPPAPLEELVAQLVRGRVRDPIVVADLVQRPLALDQLQRDGNLLLHGQLFSQSHSVLPMTSAAAATRAAGSGVSPPRPSSRGGTVSGVRQRPAKAIKPFKNPVPQARWMLAKASAVASQAPIPRCAAMRPETTTTASA